MTEQERNAMLTEIDGQMKIEIAKSNAAYQIAGAHVYMTYPYTPEQDAALRVLNETDLAITNLQHRRNRVLAQ